MNVKEYIASGILELYVLGQLTPEETAKVQEMQSKHTEVRREIHEISLTLEKYGQLSSIKAPENIAEKLFSELPPKTKVNDASGYNDVSNPVKTAAGINLLTVLFAVLMLLGFTMYFLQKSDFDTKIKEYESSLKACDSISRQQQDQYVLLNQINNPNNRIIDMRPTPGFVGVSVYLHYNAVNRKNFLQLVNLPDIGPDHAFQLWSLKDGSDPQPLDIFRDKNKIIEVAFVDRTATYAITIEPKGGSKTPTLDKLIGTMQVI